MEQLRERWGVLHLRQATGGGGGADTVMLDILRHADPEAFPSIAAYLVKNDQSIDPLVHTFAAAGVDMIQFSGRAWFDFSQLFQLSNLTRLRKISILHCHDGKARLYGCLLKLLNPRLKLAATLHGWIPHRRRSRLYIAIDKIMLRFFALKVAVSAEIRQQAMDSGISDVALLRNGVDIQRWCSNNVPGNKRRACIGFVGRLSEEKGIGDFVQLAAQVTVEQSECEFLVAGEGPELESMQDLVRTLGLGEKVRFLGLQDESELRELYQRLSLLVIPSHREGVPLVMLEAMAMGVPVVATRVGGLAEVLDGTGSGLLAAAGDVDGLVSHVLNLLSNDELRLTLAQKGRALVESGYALEDRMGVLENLYRQLVQGAAE